MLRNVTIALVVALLAVFGPKETRMEDTELWRWIWIGAAIVLGIGEMLTWLAVDLDFSRVAYFIYNLVSFKMGALPGEGLEVWLPALTVVSLSALLAYIPMTHMSHFVGKYFAYHSIRWADDPNLPGGKDEEIIHEMLNQPVSWSAPHIKGDGSKTKTWLDVATEEQKK